jgi:uncharacterized protein YyaL (SSP411 family)
MVSKISTPSIDTDPIMAKEDSEPEIVEVIKEEIVIEEEFLPEPMEEPKAQEELFAETEEIEEPGVEDDFEEEYEPREPSAFILKVGECRRKLSQLSPQQLKMAAGGIYDQIGGGFARYSTDIYWKVPHFEKMLYDNAQLVSYILTLIKLLKMIDIRK